MVQTMKNTKLGRKTRRMNCSPAVNKISVQDSCYTPKILLLIRDAYNKDHSPEDQIQETDPTKLWQILNERLVQCEKEDCWLNQIKDADVKKRIERYIFAPDKPYEWKSKPNTWLSNFDILNVLEQYEQSYKHFEFIGPTPIDFDTVVNGNCVQNELCAFDLLDHIKRGKTHIGVIFNLSPHTSGGSHWVSLFIDTKERVIFFFDSTGDKMPAEIKTFVERVQTQLKRNYMEKYRVYNSPNDHQKGNTECGVYSLFFIITMLTGVTEQNKNGIVLPGKKQLQRKMNMKDKIRLFNKGRIPDAYIEKYRNVYFND
jgi:hypothetical protein